MPGVHQRLAQFYALNHDIAADIGHEFPDQSALVTRCLLDYTCGHMSAIACQKMAHSSVIDGCMHPEVWAMAAMRSWGEQRGNCNRDLKRFLGNVEILPQPFVVKVPCLDTKSSPTVTMYDELAMFLPHLWFASVFKLEDAESLLGTNKIRSFWDHVSPSDPRLLANGGHPILQIPDYKTVCSASLDAWGWGWVQ